MDTYTAIALANAVVAVISGASSVAGMVRPALAVPGGGTVNEGTTFFAYGYGARAVPLSLVLLTLLAVDARGGLAPILVVAGLAQIGDGIIGASRRNWPMAATCAVLAAVHLGSAWWLATT
ncbi:hypothetical protein GFY24_17610 [Nocardia sp. SYP-A9097]|uniref:hypothetical protein n=1 Tax=Nocardia sp. SYP-A9097 TaxID=2663237 RepID=UPI00129BCFC4|nr:hypothetical protein [Nocardia sp. SYP-A9097]MRH89243.1 hypothetical protein [Nocardia sp. SYP-A9097]